MHSMLQLGVISKDRSLVMERGGGGYLALGGGGQGKFNPYIKA